MKTAIVYPKIVLPGTSSTSFGLSSLRGALRRPLGVTQSREGKTTSTRGRRVAEHSWSPEFRLRRLCELNSNWERRCAYTGPASTAVHTT